MKEQPEEGVCRCGNKFKLYYRNGIVISRNCPNCRFKAMKQIPGLKGVILASELGKPIESARTVKKPHRTPRQLAQRRADLYFSRYIRIKHAVEVASGDMICKCFTCGRPYAVKRIDNGHYVNREHKLVRFNPNNARPQCKHCNQFRSGKHTVFEDKLVKEVGAEEVARIKSLALSGDGEDSEIFYNEQAKLYKNLLSNEYKTRHISNPWKK